MVGWRPDAGNLIRGIGVADADHAHLLKEDLTRHSASASCEILSSCSQSVHGVDSRIADCATRLHKRSTFAGRYWRFDHSGTCMQSVQP